MGWIVGLNSLRLFAIILIIIYHFFRSALPGGFIGVEIFFVLSGYLITTKLLAEYQKHGTVSLRDFYRDRIIRLLPPLFLTVGSVLALAIFLDPAILSRLGARTAAALAFSTNYYELFSGGGYEDFISPNLFRHTWFLSLLVQFYLVFSIFVSAFLALFKEKRRAIISLAFTTGFCAIVPYLLGAFYGGILGNSDRAYLSLDTHAYGLLLGATFAAINHLIPRTPRTPHVFPALGATLALSVIAVLARKVTYDAPATYLLALPYVALLSVLLIFFVIKLQANKGERTPFINKIFRLTDWLGGYSFWVYLLHYPLFYLAPHLLPQALPIGAYAGFALIVSLLLTFICSLVLNQLAHRPLRKSASIALAFMIICAALSAVTLVRAATNSQDILAEITTSAEDEIEIIESPLLIRATTLLSHIRSDMAEQSESRRRILMLGDSVMLGAKPDLQSAIPGVVVDAKESRGIEMAIPLLQEYEALQPELVIIGLITNERTITPQLLDSIRGAIPSETELILITGYAGPLQDRTAQNARLAEYAQSHTNVRLADWYSVAHKDWSLMYGDHIHLNARGKLVYVELIKQAIGEL